ncbi:MAG: glycosyltransferase family 4 protein [Bacteroidota bacterium]
MIKVAFLLGSLNRGGTETLALDCFNHVEDTEFDLIGIHRNKGDLFNDFQQSKVELIQLKPRFLFDLVYLSKLRKAIKKNKIQIIHSHQFLDALYAKLACIGLSVKHVLTFHGFDFKYSKKAKFLLSLILKKTDLNLYVSNCLKNHYVNKFQLDLTKQKVVPNGIAWDKFENSQKSAIRQELEIESDTLLFGSVGNFVSGRNQLVLCKFIALLSNQDLKFKFIFVGSFDGKDKGVYQECIDFCTQNNLNDIVLFLGSRKDVPSILYEIDAFFYASQNDSFGIAVVEAISKAIPVFTNDWESMKEITKNGELAFLYKTDDEEDLFLTWDNYFKNKERFLAKINQNALEVKRKYDIKNHLNELNEIYNSLLKK